MDQPGTLTETPAEPRAKVVVCDADPVARRVIKDTLRESGRFTIVAEARNGVEATELTLHYRPDILLTEAVLAGTDVLAMIEHVTTVAPSVRVVILTLSDDPELALGALRRGAAGVLSKEVAPPAIVRALQGVHAGEAAVSRELTAQVIRMLRRPPEAGRGIRPVQSTLTHREWEVLNLMVGGASTVEMAEELVLTEDTIYSHMKSIRRKLGVSNRAEAVAAAQQLIDTAVAA